MSVGVTYGLYLVEIWRGKPVKRLTVKMLESLLSRTFQTDVKVEKFWPMGVKVLALVWLPSNWRELVGVKGNVFVKTNKYVVREWRIPQYRRR